MSTYNQRNNFFQVPDLSQYTDFKLVNLLATEKHFSSAQSFCIAMKTIFLMFVAPILTV
jgi:hypothetical protein